MKSYVIGLDGGGTKTEAAAYDQNGQLIAQSIKGFANLLNDENAALNNIVSALSELINVCGLEKLKGVYLGVAGSEVSNNAEKISNKIKKELNIDSVVMNDSEIALKAMLKGKDGILTIAGTGSIAFGVNNNKTAKCGGWGNILGDEGSGYSIAIRALKRMIYEDENAIEYSELTKNIMKRLDIKKVDEITGFVYSSTKDEIASLAEIISNAADNGEKIASEILTIEGIELAKTVINVYKKLGFEGCSIALVGGVIRNSNILRETFLNYLRKNIHIKEIVCEKTSPTIGAYYINKIKEEKGEEKL